MADRIWRTSDYIRRLCSLDRLDSIPWCIPPPWTQMETEAQIVAAGVTSHRERCIHDWGSGLMMQMTREEIVSGITHWLIQSCPSNLRDCTFSRGVTRLNILSLGRRKAINWTFIQVYKSDRYLHQHIRHLIIFQIYLWVSVIRCYKTWLQLRLFRLIRL